MKKKTLKKDIKKCLSKSKGRFFSIMSLIALGSFALVGLQAAGPDMRETGRNYYRQLNTADLTVIGDYGIDETNAAVIDQLSGASAIEYGYLKDVTIKDTLVSVRIFSETDTISRYELTEGDMPEADNEIALASYLSDDYAIGDSISFTEKEDFSGNYALTRHTFTIVGFVNSGEILSAINMGNSTAGSGQLQGYGVVTPEAFDSDIYMIARISFSDTADMDPYSEEYTSRIQKHKEELEALLADQPALRLAAIKETYQTAIDEGQKSIDDAKNALSEAEHTLAAMQQEIDDARTAISAAKQSGKDPAKQMQITAAEAELVKQETQYQLALQTYESKKRTADAEIAEAEERLSDAEHTVRSLKLPSYAVDTRREIPGAEGYRIYANVSDIIDSLADVFPIFLYLVAALVTLTTMTRFVDEERMNIGTLKALGYSNRDILKKFAVYGWTASISGAVIGITAGHILIPMIVYHAYGKSFTYPAIELHIYPVITCIALVLAFLSAVVPTYLAVLHELHEKPAALLLPKPPAAGSKILLERIRPLWNHMSFTHKVTARNIFRYKKRMLMTIFGVCGGVAMLFAGLSVQHSISGVNERQFTDILKYDLIAAKKDGITGEQERDIQKLLTSDAVQSQMPIVYEEMTKTAGDNMDQQEIKLIVPEDTEDFEQYIHLENRKSKETIDLSEPGIVISERLAELLDVTAGDTVTLTDADHIDRTFQVAAVTEMYTGHFAFLNSTYYTEIFQTNYCANANLISLKDHSTENAQKQASEFIRQSGISGVVQNTTLINQVNTVVKSLNKIMDILILVATLLTVVILYNLTNINVSERIRELSTVKVLGFYNKEVTMYIYRETIVLTLFGIAAGFLLGDLLYLYILAVVPPDDVMFNPALGGKAFLIPALVVIIISTILGLEIHKRLKSVNMLEALKSVD